MDIFIIFLTTVDVVIAILLIGLVLIQQSKGGGLGSSFGGAAESVFGGAAVNHLAKLTVYLITAFFIITLSLAAYIGRQTEGKSALEVSTENLDDIKVEVEETAEKAISDAKKVDIKQPELENIETTKAKTVENK